MRYSLGFVLALSLSGLQFLAILVVVSTSYVTSERAMLTHARGLLSEASSAAIDHTKRFLEPARDAAELSSRIIENEIVDPNNPQTLEQFLFQLVQGAPHISGTYFGDLEGNFTYVMRSDGPGPFRTKFISVADDARTIELVWRTEDAQIVAREFDPADTYDHRTRQWYIDAVAKGESIWTSPYIFFSSQQPGISVASPVTKADGNIVGVVGVDIEISDISMFLSELAVGTEGVALILNENGDVIAHPQFDSVTAQNSGGPVSLVSVSEIDDPTTRAAFADFDGIIDLSVGAVQSEFEFDGDAYMALLEPISDQNLPWVISVFAPENDFIQDIKDNRKRNVWIAAFVSLLTAAVGVTLAELILKPVRAFAVRTSLVSQGEVPASALPPKTYKELRDANQTLINEIAQRRVLDAKVQDLNRELSHASRINMMGQMATGLAHELSQPLTAISQNVDTAISIAKQDDAPQAELLTILSELDEQAHQGGDIIRSLRGFAKKDVHGKDPIDLDDLLSQTYRLMRRDFETYDVEVERKIPALLHVAGNRIEFAQVLTNLMRNALDAMIAAQTNAKKISISARQVGDKVEVEVADTGPGVDPNVTLFKQFQTSKEDGLGLGLTISRAIVEANGGRLWYDPDINGVTRFLFTVPVHAIPESKT